MPSRACLEADVQLSDGIQGVLDIREAVLRGLQVISDFDTAQEDAVNQLADAEARRDRRASKKIIAEINKRYEKRYQALLDIEAQCDASLSTLQEMATANKRVHRMCPKEMRTLTEESLEARARDARALRNKVRFKAAEARRLRDGGERGRTWFEWAMSAMQGKQQTLSIGVQTSLQIPDKPPPPPSHVPRALSPPRPTSKVPSVRATQDECTGQDAWHRFCARERKAAAQQGQKLTMKELSVRYRKECSKRG